MDNIEELFNSKKEYKELKKEYNTIQKKGILSTAFCFFIGLMLIEINIILFFMFVFTGVCYAIHYGNKSCELEDEIEKYEDINLIDEEKAG